MNKKDIFMRVAMTYFKAMHRDDRLYDALQSVNISYNDDEDRETCIWTDIEDFICELVGDPTGIALEEIIDRAWEYADKKTLPKAEIMKWLEELWDNYTQGKEA